MGGLGAFLEPCRAGLAAEAQKCTPEVPKLVQFGRILEGQVGAKTLQKINSKIVKFLIVFRSSLGDENSTKITPKWKPKSTPRRFPSGLEAKVVKV